MASNYTGKYNLNQWAASDRVLRTEFNADNAKIDAALGSLASEVGGKASAAAVAGLQNTVSSLSANKADKSALDSLKTTVTQHTASLAVKGNCQACTTSYTGTGTYGSANPCSLTFPHRPVVVIVSNGSYRLLLVQGVRQSWSESLTGGEGSVSVEWSGNTVRWYASASSRAQMNQSGAYSVAALLDAEH